MTKSRCLILLATVTGVLASCHGDIQSLVGSPDPNAPTLTVIPTHATITVGATIQLADSIGNNPNNLAYTIAWESTNAAAATVSDSGLVTTKAPTPAVQICATATGATYTVGNCGTLIIAAPANGQTASSTHRGTRRNQP